MSLVSFRPILRPFTVPSAAPVVETKDRDGKGRVRHEVNSHSVKTMETFSYFNSSMWTPKHDGWTWNSCCNSLHKIFATRLQGFSPTQPQEHEWGRPPTVGDAGWRGLACGSSQKVLAVKIEALRRPVTVLPTKLRTVATKLAAHCCLNINVCCGVEISWWAELKTSQKQPQTKRKDFWPSCTCVYNRAAAND